MRQDNREERNRLIDELCKSLDAQLITRIGNVALIYRRAEPAT